MEILTQLLTIIGFIIVTPIWIIAIVLIVMGIQGIIKKDFTKFKKILKIWGYFWLAFIILLFIFFISTFIIDVYAHYR